MGERMTEPEFHARSGTWVGAPVRRREDPRLLTGQGRFVDDIHLPGMLHVQFVRATIAHGRITRIDLSARAWSRRSRPPT
jgi:carbon-monoxide dehydrogenase large subunit